MTGIAERDPVSDIEHVGKKRGDGHEVMSFGSPSAAVPASASVNVHDLLNPSAHRLGGVQTPGNLRDAALPVGAPAARSGDGEPLLTTGLAAHFPVPGVVGSDMRLAATDDAGEIQFVRVVAPAKEHAATHRTGLALAQLGRSAPRFRQVDSADRAGFVKVCCLHTRILSHLELVEQNGVNCGNAKAVLTTPLCQSAAKPADSATFESRRQEGSETRAEETIMPNSAPPERDEIVHSARKLAGSSAPRLSRPSRSRLTRSSPRRSRISLR